MTTKAKWCGTLEQWICFGDPDERVRRREMAANVIQFRKTGNREYWRMASLARRNPEDGEFLDFLFDFTDGMK